MYAGLSSKDKSKPKKLVGFYYFHAQFIFYFDIIIC
jgi:hypothetical protein